MALTEKEERGNVLFLSIVDGKFTQKVKQGTPGATYRKYVSADGTEYHINEIIHKNLKGNITKLAVVEGKYGPQLLIEIRNEGEVARVYINTASAYFSNFCKRLPNIELGEEVILNPYSFVGDSGRNLTGITIYQEGAKIMNYYWDTAAKKYNGLPEPAKPWIELSSVEQKAYYLILTQYFIETIEFFNNKIPTSKEQLAAYDHLEKMGIPEKSEPTPEPGKGGLFQQEPDSDQPSL